MKPGATIKPEASNSSAPEAVEGRADGGDFAIDE